MFQVLFMPSEYKKEASLRECSERSKQSNQGNRINVDTFVSEKTEN